MSHTADQRLKADDDIKSLLDLLPPIEALKWAHERARRALDAATKHPDSETCIVSATYLHRLEAIATAARIMRVKQDAHSTAELDSALRTLDMAESRYVG